MRATNNAHEVLVKNGTQRKCNFCNELKIWEFSHFRLVREATRTFDRKIFMDEYGRTWDGLRCPECNLKRKTEWRKRKNLNLKPT